MNQPIQDRIERVLDMFETSFVHAQGTELILHRKWNIYFLLSDLTKPSEFDYKLLSYLSFYTAAHHYGQKTKQCLWARNRLNRWFRREFTHDELQIIYQKIGCGANRPLGVKFIEGGLDMGILTAKEE